MQGSAVPSEADGACISENNDEISPEILYRNEKENKPDCGLVRNITGKIVAFGSPTSSTSRVSGAFSQGATNSALYGTGGTQWDSYEIYFDAGSRSTGSNPMYGYTSSEIRPINISAIPLIVAI